MLSDVLKRVFKKSNFFGRYHGTQLAAAMDASAALGQTILLKAVNYAVLAADSGKTLTATAAVNFTLPAAAAELRFFFAQTADANMAILAPASNDSIIVKGDAGADSVTFSTATEKIGSVAMAVAVSLDSGATYKWLVVNLGGTTATIA